MQSLLHSPKFPARLNLIEINRTSNLTISTMCFLELLCTPQMGEARGGNPIGDPVLSHSPEECSQHCAEMRKENSEVTAMVYRTAMDACFCASDLVYDPYPLEVLDLIDPGHTQFYCFLEDDRSK